MISNPSQYHEAALSYLQASEKIWQRELGAPYQPDYLLAPTLHCLGHAYELAMKALLLSNDEGIKSLRAFGHDFGAIWMTKNAASVREKSRAESVFWQYPWTLSDIETPFEKFEEMLFWLSEQHSGKGGNGTADYSLRYPSSLTKEVYPPDFMMIAAKAIFGMIEDEISK